MTEIRVLRLVTADQLEIMQQRLNSMAKKIGKYPTPCQTFVLNILVGFSWKICDLGDPWRLETRPIWFSFHFLAKSENKIAFRYILIDASEI